MFGHFMLGVSRRCLLRERGGQGEYPDQQCRFHIEIAEKVCWRVGIVMGMHETR